MLLLLCAIITVWNNLPSLRDVVDTYGLRAQKSLGQNFILNEQITDKIVRLAGLSPSCHVVEIGPGPGGLTRSLLKAGVDHLTAIERDKRCLLALQQLVGISQGRLRVIEGDALKINLKSLAGGPFHIVANLPYNIGTRLLLGWCTQLSFIKRMTLMFQKEVADRLIAVPGTSTYGSLSVWIQWQLETFQLLTLAPAVFSPAPKVYSAVVQLIPRPHFLYPAHPSSLQKLLATAFQQRRKMLRRSLRGLEGFHEGWFDQTGIAPHARPEELSVEDFCRLSAMLSSNIDNLK